MKTVLKLVVFAAFAIGGWTAYQWATKTYLPGQQTAQALNQFKDGNEAVRSVAFWSGPVPDIAVLATIAVIGLLVFQADIRRAVKGVKQS